MVSIVLFLVAFVLFLLAAFGVSAPRFSFLAGGLACCALAWLLGAWPTGVS